MRAGVTRRFGAYYIDWYLLEILARASVQLALLPFFLYFVLFPWENNRISVFRLEIAGLNNEKPGWRQILIWNCFGHLGTGDRGRRPSALLL